MEIILGRDTSNTKMSYYFVLEIPYLEFHFAVCVGWGLERLVRAWCYMEYRGRYHYYLSEEPFQQMVHRDYYALWANIEGGRGLLFVLRRRGLIISGRQYRSRVANVVLHWFRHVGESLTPGGR